MGAERVADLVTVADLARQRGKHVSSVRRWLLDLDRQHGGGIAFRIGAGKNARLYTTTAALARVAPHLVGTNVASEDVALMQKDIDTLVDRTTSLSARLRDLTHRVSALERHRA